MEREPLSNIFLPLDFSEASDLMVKYVSSLAKKYRSRVTLFHAIEEWMVIHVAGGYDVTGLIRDLEARSRDMLEKAKAELERNGVNADIYSDVPVADPGIAIVDAAKDSYASEIFVASKGHGLHRIIPLGSTVSIVVKLSSVPVVRFKVVKGEDGKPKIHGPPDPFKRVMVCVDRNATRDMMRYSIALALKSGGRLYFLHVIEGGREPEGKVKALLKTASSMAEEAGVDNEVIVVTGSPYKSILQLAIQLDITSILMGRTVSRSFNEYIMGSTLDRVLAFSSQPVIVYPLGEVER